MSRVLPNRFNTLSKVLILLMANENSNDPQWLSVGQLAAMSGANYETVRHQASRWRSWAFLKAEVRQLDGRPVWTYRLASKGQKFIEAVRVNQFDMFERFRLEIKAHRQTVGLS